MRLKTSAQVLWEIMSAPDKRIPDDPLEKSQCIVIVPVFKKAAFVVGGQYGKVSSSAGVLPATGNPRQQLSR